MEGTVWLNCFPPLTNFADNNSIETEADAILDFSEENPFGTP